jgi:hypothetical protein
MELDHFRTILFSHIQKSCLLVCSFFLLSWLSVTRHSVHMLQPYSSVILYFVQNLGYIYFHFNLSICFIIWPSVSCFFSLTYLVSAAAVLLASLAVMVQFSLTCDKAGRTSYLLTYSMEQSPSWEANWSAASQEISRILWNLKVHHLTHKRTPLVPILS